MKTMNETHTSRDMRLTAERALAAEVGEVLQRGTQEHLQWQGSSIDLMEALHTAFCTYTLCDDEGQMLSFTAIVQRTCHMLHTPVPRNPYECAARGRRRKGQVRRPYMERYAMKVLSDPCRRPLWEQITTC